MTAHPVSGFTTIPGGHAEYLWDSLTPDAHTALRNTRGSRLTRAPAPRTRTELTNRGILGPDCDRTLTDRGAALLRWLHGDTGQAWTGTDP